MLDWSQTQPHYWLPGRPSHQPQHYTPLTTSLARFNSPSQCWYTLLCQQQEVSAAIAGTQLGGGKLSLYNKYNDNFQQMQLVEDMSEYVDDTLSFSPNALLFVMYFNHLFALPYVRTNEFTYLGLKKLLYIAVSDSKKKNKKTAIYMNR